MNIKRKLLMCLLGILPFMSLFGQRVIERDFNCGANQIEEICDNEIDDDGDGFIDCADLDCYVDQFNRLVQPIEIARNNLAECRIFEEQTIDFISKNLNYLDNKGIEGVADAEAEAIVAVECIAAAMVSVSLEYTINWFIINLEKEEEYPFFATKTAKQIFANNGLSIGANATLACAESVIPFRLSKIEEFILNAGTGFTSGFIQGTEQEYNKYIDSPCDITAILLDKIDWGNVFRGAGTDALISVITVGIATRLGPKIRTAYAANTAVVEAKIRRLLGDDVWEAIRNKFLRNIDELFAAYPNLKELSPNIKTRLNDLSLSEDALTKLDEDLADSQLFGYFDEGLDGLVEKIKAWEVLSDFPILRIKTDQLENISNYLVKNSDTENAIKQGLNDVGEYVEDFLNGIKNAIEDLSLINGRSALPNEIADAVNRIKQHRINVNIPSNRNFGYLEGDISGVTVDNKIWGSGEAKPDTEPQIFNAIEVGGWVRNTDSEYKMLNKLANDLGGVLGSTYPNIAGTIKIVSERPYCNSCQGVIQQFHEMFPNLKLILIDGIRKED